MEALVGPVEIDASALEFVASSGLRLLLRLAERNGGSVHIVGARPPLRRLIQVTGTGEQLVVAD